jgi:hypothetical protein
MKGTHQRNKLTTAQSQIALEFRVLGLRESEKARASRDDEEKEDEQVQQIDSMG